jgi:glutaminyl-tRNA synthetase
MAVLKPLKLVIDNYPESKLEEFEAENNPEDPTAGTRKIQFSRELYIERDDYMEQPAKGYFRLFPGSEVRLKHAYFVKCGAAVKDRDGNVTELHCTYDPASRGGNAPDGRKVKGTLHWVSARHAADAEVKLYEQLFTEPKPTTDSPVNPTSLTVLKGCKVEPSLQQAKPGDTFQFLRHAYFCADSKDHKDGRLVFNRTVTLRDSWAKEQKK